MKILILISLLFLSFIPHGSSFKEKIPPPGTIYLKENLFIDKQPVSNLAYVECLYSIEDFWSLAVSQKMQHYPPYGIKVDGSDFHYDSNWIISNRELINKMKLPKIQYPDMDTSASLKDYLANPAIRDYPVLGVNFEQAQLFCKWRSDMVMLLYALRSKNSREREKYYSTVNFRLPETEEWEYAFNKMGHTRFAIASPYNKPVSNKEKNSFIAYEANVAELLLPKNNSVLIRSEQVESISLDSLNNFGVSPRETGFRCICEVTE